MRTINLIFKLFAAVHSPAIPRASALSVFLSAGKSLIPPLRARHVSEFDVRAAVLEHCRFSVCGLLLHSLRCHFELRLLGRRCCGCSSHLSE